MKYRRDYYPFGLPFADNYFKEAYRHGYQGQYAEKDEETGWNAFELRMYDPIIARWMRPDPYGQFASPYLAMGNNGVNRVDPDGGFDEFARLADGSLSLVKETGKNYHLIFELDGSITKIGLDMFRLPELVISGQDDFVMRAVTQTQIAFVNNSFTRSMAVLGASVASGPRGNGELRKIFCFQYGCNWI